MKKIKIVIVANGANILHKMQVVQEKLFFAFKKSTVLLEVAFYTVLIALCLNLRCTEQLQLLKQYHHNIDTIEDFLLSNAFLVL